MTNLTDLYDQARMTYHVWPLWLALKRQRLAQHLRLHPDIVALLRSAGLPIPEPAPIHNLTLEPLPADTCLTYVVIANPEPTLVVERTHAHHTERAILLSLSQTKTTYLTRAATCLNQLCQTQPADVSLHAAYQWALWHKRAVKSLTWQAVEPVTTAEPAPLGAWG